MLFYPQANTSLDQESPILSWHIFPKKGVWVVLDLEHKLGRASTEKSLNIILDGKRGLERMRSPELIDIDLSNIRFFYKDNVITFHSKEATYEYACSRYVGDKLSKGKIKDFFNASVEITSAFFDSTRNRINLILSSPDSLVSETLKLASLSHASSSS